jgi:hypothetical protein
MPLHHFGLLRTFPSSLKAEDRAAHTAWLATKRSIVGPPEFHAIVRYFRAS